MLQPGSLSVSQLYYHLHYHISNNLNAKKVFRVTKVLKSSYLNVIQRTWKFCLPDTGKIEDLVRAMDAADSYLQSWVGWYYRPFMTSRAKGRRCCALWDEEGNLDKILIGNTSRSYPQVNWEFCFSFCEYD